MIENGEQASPPVRPFCRRLCPDNLLQRTEESIHFFRSIVVSQADAQESSILLNTQPFGQPDRIVVAVPGEETALAEPFRQLAGRMAGNPHCHSGAALSKSLEILNAIKLQSGNGLQSRDQPLQQGAFMALNHGVGSEQCLPPSDGLRRSPASQIGQIFYTGGNPGDAFVV